MFSNKMTNQKKTLILPVILAILIVGVAAFPSHFSSAATTKAQPLKVVGMVKFVLKGTVTAISVDAITLHITNTSKNAKIFDGKDKVISVGTKTTITKNGKNIALSQIKSGNKVKVFGIFDKKTGAMTAVRWIKVVPK